MELDIAAIQSALGNPNANTVTLQNDATRLTQTMKNAPAKESDVGDQIMNELRKLHETHRSYTAEDATPAPKVETVQRLPDGPASDVLGAGRDASADAELDDTFDQLIASYRYIGDLSLAHNVASQIAGSIGKLVSTA